MSETSSTTSLLAGGIEPLSVVERRDVVLWCEISKLIGANSLFVDRRDEITSPFRIETAERCRLPRPISGFGKTYEEICDERAGELLGIQAASRKPLALLYSGGIDSTLMLVSFMKRLSNSELRDRLVIYLNTNSVNENPKFYRQFIRPSFRMESSEKSLDLLDGESVVVGAEFNDHLFGNYLNHMLSLVMGEDYFALPYSRDTLREILSGLGFSPEGLDFWVTELDRSRSRQNLTEIATMSQFFWWFNFCFRWQATYFSMILKTPQRFRSSISSRFLSQHFHHFFMTDDFQRWSMVHPELKIKDTWESYKWPAKDLIYRFDGNAEYRDHKIKAPSLNYILMQRRTAQALTSEYRLVDWINPVDYLRDR